MAYDSSTISAASPSPFNYGLPEPDAAPTVDAGVTRAALARTFRYVDVALALGALFAVFLATHLKQLPPDFDGFLAMRVTVKNLVLLTGFVAVWSGVCRAFKLYAADRPARRVELWRLLAATTCGSSFIVLFMLLSNTGQFGVAELIGFWLLSSALMVAARYVARALTIYVTATTAHPRQIILVGSGARALKFGRELSHARAADHALLGFVDTGAATHEIAPEVRARMLGTLDDLEEILVSRVVDEVLIALPLKSCYAEVERTIRTCERVGVAVKCPLDIFQSSVAKRQYEPSHLPTVAFKSIADDRRLILKRLMDVTGALAGLVLFAPLMLLIALLIKTTSRGPVIFAQERYGFNRRRFKMYKFRTMVTNAEALQASLETLNEARGPNFKIKNDPRVTRVGRLLRKTSLDELPQLWNVLRGEMSIVGPRPLPARDVARFNENWFMRRFAVRPGLTCLWQISGRSAVDFDNFVRLDLEYIDNWSPLLDVKIILRTVPAVCKGSGAF